MKTHYVSVSSGDNPQDYIREYTAYVFAVWRIWIRFLKSCEVPQCLSTNWAKETCGQKQDCTTHAHSILVIHPFSSNAFWGQRSCPLAAPGKHCWCKVFDGLYLWSGPRIPNYIQVTCCTPANVYVSSTATICSSLYACMLLYVDESNTSSRNVYRC